MKMFRQKQSPRGYGKIDSGVWYGLGISLFCILVGALLSGGTLAGIVDVASIFIVAGGTVGATMVQFSGDDLRYTYHKVREAIRSRSGEELFKSTSYFMQLSHRVRAEGRVTVLDTEANRSKNPYIRLGLELAADGQRPDEIRRILETERALAKERGDRAVQVLETMGGYAPALGLIGTVVGLIQMLGTLSNPASVGPAMATALVTTLYGALASNLVFLPLAGKIKIYVEREMLHQALILEGILSLANEENPMLVEQRFKSFRPAMGA
jgi:chemotaxis protein MotA